MILMADTSFMGTEKTLYVLKDGLGQALITRIPARPLKSCYGDHVLLEIREGYKLGKELLDTTIKRAHF